MFLQKLNSFPLFFNNISCARYSSSMQMSRHKLILRRIQDLRKIQNVGFRRTPNGRPVAKEKTLLPAPFEGVRIETGPVPMSNIRKATLFAISFSAGTFVTATIFEYEGVRKRLKDKKFGNFNWVKNKLAHKVDTQPEWQRQVLQWWNNLSVADRVFIPICVANIVVFGLWRIPRMQPFMVKYFCSNPAARAVCWPMLLSTFSHYSLFHIFANMYVLHSFTNAAVATLGKEQFLTLFLSAGVFSSLTSYIYKAATSQVGLSLGASGAIMAVLAYVCAEYPETKLNIILLPMYTFAAGTAIKVIMGLDLAGCILGWKFFDHAAHLGGALFGLFWCYVGKTTLWPKREYVLRYWHDIRSEK